MKVKWRQHGIILVTLLAVVAIAHDLSIAAQLTPMQRVQGYGYSFFHNHRPFNYYYNFLIPQIGSIVFLYGCYLWIALVIAPKIHLDKLPKTGIQTFKRFVWIIFQLLLICILLGPGVNFASFYINPYTLHYGVNYFPLTFGSHPQPFANVFGGLDTSIGIVVIYMVCIAIREVIIYYVEQSAYRVMVTNVVTLVMAAYFGILILVPTFNLGGYYWYKFYWSCLPSILILILSNIYWLFPANGEGSLFKWNLAVPLLFTSFVYTLVFSRFLGEEWSFIHFAELWAFEIFVITPVSWFGYKGQQNRILQIRGMEKELVKSKADLQFLRSQINPHFLFNALNTLYGTALMDGSKNTAAGIQKLGDMMRFMLHENNQDFIPINKEIEYLKNYIDLQKLRTQVSPDILIEDSINITSNDNQIAPMLLIPFVENAFKHGVSLTDPSWIKINLDVDYNNIRFEVRNSLHADQNNDPEKEHNGIGLQNVKERLQLIYPGKHELIYGEERNEYVVKLSVQL